MRQRKSGTDFSIWTAQGAWFWSVVCFDRNGGAVGAAATEAEALREVRAAIELMPEPDHNFGVYAESCRKSCNELWHLSLARYATLVAAA
jgi:hypothetical protein